MGLPEPQVELLNRIVAANPNTIVVVFSGSAIEIAGYWGERTAGLLQVHINYCS